RSRRDGRWAGPRGARSGPRLRARAPRLRAADLPVPGHPGKARRPVGRDRGHSAARVQGGISEGRRSQLHPDGGAGEAEERARVGRTAARQCGRVAWFQLRKLGVVDAVIHDWLNQGYLHPKLPGVYAVGHDAPSVEADLAAAVLYAGPGAMLSHGTAAAWWGLIDNQPSTINVSTPRRCRSRRGIKVHQRRNCQRTAHKGLPVTSVAQTLLDYAAGAALPSVRV